MKKIFFCIAIILALAAVGCGKKSVGCQDYAPADVTLSWTGFNSVSDVNNYFDCHNSTVNAHMGKTLRIRGYLYYGEPNGSYTPAYMDTNNHHEIGPIIRLTSDSSHYGPKSSAFMVYTQGQWFYENYDACLTKEIFVTGKIFDAIVMNPAPCCERAICLNGYIIDTIERF